MSDLNRQRKAVKAAVDRFAASSRRASSGGGVRLTITDDAPGNARGLDRVFVGLGATVEAMPEAIEHALPVIRRAFAANFAREGTARGAWKPLRPRTLAERRRLGFPPGPILKRTGDLRDLVLTTPLTTRRRGADVEAIIAPHQHGRGKARRYYRAQALGRREINLPSRPMVVVGPQDAVKITSAVSRYLRTRATREGLA